MIAHAALDAAPEIEQFRFGTSTYRYRGHNARKKKKPATKLSPPMPALAAFAAFAAFAAVADFAWIALPSPGLPWTVLGDEDGALKCRDGAFKCSDGAFKC